MDELIGMVSQKIGVSADQARTAVDTVVVFLKEKLPDPIASQLDGVLSGNISGAVGGLEDLAKSVGGMIGGVDTK